MKKENVVLVENKEATPVACPVMTTLAVIGGKWKPAILWELRQHRIRRFGALKRALPDITQKMLTQQLRELEADGIIHRKVYAEVPPRVEYTQTDYGRSLTPILDEMAHWGMRHQGEQKN
ncbi:MAG: helix-turn-helix domain-containing protein [Tunicatimonas sp.]